MSAPSSSLRKPVPIFAASKPPPIVANRPTPDVAQDKSEWLISEDYSILQVIRYQQGMPLNLTSLMPGHTPNWDLAADAVNALSPVYRSARNCRSRFENVIMLREEANNGRSQTNHLFQEDSNAAYTNVLRKRFKGVVDLAQKRKAQAESVKIKKQQQKVQVVAATSSLPEIQHTATRLCGKLGVVVSAQTTTLPSTTLTTSNVLKGRSAVVEQQQTAAILQQAAASSAGITGQHAVTLAVQATASQAQGQQVQIQVQPSAYYFLVTPQAQVVTPQTRIKQLPQNASTINIAPPVAVQNVLQASSILSPSGTIVQQMPADSTIQSF